MTLSPLCFRLDIIDYIVYLQVLETFVTECLILATKNRHTSIAFPSLGTGKLGYPVDQVAKQMFTCVENYSVSTPKSSVKEVIFVVYDQDHKSIKVSIFNI